MSLRVKVLLCRVTEPPISHILLRLLGHLHVMQQLVTVHLSDRLTPKTLAQNYCSRLGLPMQVTYNVPIVLQLAKSNGCPSTLELFSASNVVVFTGLLERTYQKYDHLLLILFLLHKISLSYLCSSVIGSAILSGKQL